MQATGTVRDVSSSGASVRVERPVPVAAEVVVIARGKELRASVRACSRTVDGFVVGVEFDDASQGVLLRA